MLITEVLTINEAAKAALISELSREIDLDRANQVLETLFFTWIGSEESDNTDSSYRAEVAHCYRQLSKFMQKVNQIERKGVNHD